MHVLGQRMKVLEGRESAGYDAVELASGRRSQFPSDDRL